MFAEFPQSLSRYQPIAEIGHGGMAEVVLAQMRVGRGLKKLVVMKRIWSDLANDPDFVSHFVREARIGARMNHPNIVQTFEVLEDLERPTVVMEYLDGQTLTSVLNRMVSSGGLSLSLRMSILADVLTALDYAHELTDYDGSQHGVVHRDVNPRHVIVTYDGQVKLFDFGLAKTLSAAYQTRVGGRSGRVAYMAPEQFRGRRIDRRVDIFSVGVMLWEMIAGRRLWQGMNEEAIVQHLTTRSSVRPLPHHLKLPRGLDKICARALSVDPNARFQTAAEFVYELQRVLPDADSGSEGWYLGDVVSRAFADERAERKSLIEYHVREHGIPFGTPAGATRRPQSRNKSPRRGTGRVPPPSGSGTRVPPVAIWTEDDASDAGVTLTLDAESVISVAPLTDEPIVESRELQKRPVYVPRNARHRLRWASVGFLSAVIAIAAAWGIRTAVTELRIVRRREAPPSITQNLQNPQNLAANSNANLGGDARNPGARPSPNVNGTSQGTPMLMNVLTHEAPARRRSRASAPAATKEAPPSGVRRADRDAPVAEPEQVRVSTSEDAIMSRAAPVAAPATVVRAPDSRRPLDTADPFQP